MPDMDYNCVDDRILDALRSISGKLNVISDKEKMTDYSHDEYSLEHIRQFPEAVVMPSSSDEVSKILRLCSENRIPLTPRGGGTGLCGGCIPQSRGIVMQFDRLNRVIEVDAENAVVTVESGVRLTDFYQAVESEGFFFPPHPGDESACIGGLVATNAGGARAVKYGVIRNYIRGLEVVFPGGEVVELGGKFLKNSSGYSLLHLMIGSEGTLGVVTKAMISLMAPPKVMFTMVAVYDRLEDAIQTVPDLLKNNIIPMAMEFVEKDTVTLSAAACQLEWPFSKGEAYIIMIVDGQNFDEIAALSEHIHEHCMRHKALDILVADTPRRQREILKIRSSMYEVMKDHTMEILDITVPRAQIASFVEDVQRVAETYGTWLPTYGHAADGNVHVHIMKDRWEAGEWKEIPNAKDNYAPIRGELHEIGKNYKGICSGEHGIGMIKKELLVSFLGETHIDMMRRIKRAFDPHGILNPGKIFDLR